MSTIVLLVIVYYSNIKIQNMILWHLNNKEMFNKNKNKL